MSVLHVAVDTTNLKHDWRGITRYVKAIFPRLAAHPDVRLSMVDPGFFGYRVPRDADVVWRPANGTFFRTTLPSVATFHDAVPFRFAAADPKRRANEQGPWVRSVETAHAFIANSHFTATEMTAYAHIPLERQTVTLLAVEPEIFSPAGALPPDAPDRAFVFFAGAAEERKNLPTLLAAHARAFPANDVPLVVAGGAPPPGARATWLGVLDAPALAAWYRAATIVAVPSVYEGFGFPLLEAMACGRAVLASRASSLPEVGGAGCAWIDDPLDVAAWAEELRALVIDGERRAALQAAAVARAAAFSWDRCAAQTLEVLQRAANANG